MKRTVQAIHDENNAELPLKKRNSSLFSIATVCESDENDQLNISGSSRLGNGSNASSTVGLDLMAADKADIVGEISSQDCLQSPVAPSLPSVTPQSLSCTEDSSTGTDDDDGSTAPVNDNNKYALKPPLHPSSLLVRAPDLEPRIITKPTTIASDNKTVVACTVSTTVRGSHDLGDYRTGIVFEAGSDHYDRHCRLHKERPLRVTSVMESLKKADNGIYDRCCVLGEDDGEKAESRNDVEGVAMPTNSATSFLEDDDYLRVHLPGYMKR